MNGEIMEDPLITYTRNKFSSLGKLCDPFDGTQSRPQPETGWLIERREPNAEWLYVVDWFSFGWTVDSLKAIRFARRQDAEQVLKMIETEVAFATQHQWNL